MHVTLPSYFHYGSTHQIMIKVGGYMVQAMVMSSNTMVERFLQEVYPHEDRKHIIVGLDIQWYRVTNRNKMALMRIYVGDWCLLF
jgi:hypothetical protein